MLVCFCMFVHVCVTVCVVLCSKPLNALHMQFYIGMIIGYMYVIQVHVATHVHVGLCINPKRVLHIEA